MGPGTRHPECHVHSLPIRSLRPGVGPVVDDRVAADVAGVQRIVLLETIRGKLLGALHVGAVGSWRLVEQCEATHECDDRHGDHGLGRSHSDRAAPERQRFSKRGPGWFVGGGSILHFLY